MTKASVKANPESRHLVPAGWGVPLPTVLIGVVVLGFGGYALHSGNLVGAAGILVGAAIAGFSTWRARRSVAADARPYPGQRVLAQALEACPEAIMITAADGAVLYANPAYAALVGKQDDGHLPALDTLVRGDDDAEAALARLREGVRSDGTARDEVRVTSDVFGERWLGLWAHRLDGESERVVWYVVDRTSRRRNSEAVRGQQQKLVNFLDKAPVGFYSVNSAGRFVFVNGTFAAWLGYGPKELIETGVHLVNLIVEGEVAPPDPASWSDASSPHQSEIRLRHRDGGSVPLFVSQSLVLGPDGELQTRSAVLNLTEEQKWKAALREAEERFHDYFDNAPIGIVLIDGSGRVIECNRTFASLVGLDPAQIDGPELTAFIVETDRPDVAERIARVERGEVAGRPLAVRLQGKRERVVHLFFSPIERDESESRRFIVHLIDATEQKELELQFAQSQKMQAVGQLAGGIAHDFNNLLTAMIGFCDLLMLRHQAGDQSFADIMQIKQNANRAANLVRQLLAFSRRQTLQPEVLSITDVLGELSALLRRLIGEDIELDMVHGRDIGAVKVDQGQFEQTIINLAVNARDAMPGGGKVTIRTSNIEGTDPSPLAQEIMPSAEYVLIEVSDNGSGIPEDIIDKIFEPFFTTKEVGAGTGLGLATAYGIVKQTGGYLFVESGEGEGATFRIYLPRYHVLESETVVEAQVEAQPRDLTGEGTILLVEDESPVRIFAVRALRNKGYTVLEAGSGEEALALAETHDGDIDLLISDVVMPQMSGPQLIRHFREVTPELKVILISGYAEDAFSKDLDEGTVVEFLAKPFSLRQLAGKVKEVMSA